MVVAADIDLADLAEQSGLDDVLLRIEEVRPELTLRADLHDALEAAGGGDHRLALEHVAADRLLHVDVGVRFHRGDGGQRVPVIGSADEHDIELVVLEHLAIIAVGARRLFRLLPLGDDRGRVARLMLIDVANGKHFDRRDLNQAEQIVLAVPSGADQPDAMRLFFCSRGHMRAHGR